MQKETKLFVVIPCYNEEEVLEETTKRLKEKLKELIKSKNISNDSRVMYVNDGSKDKTWDLIIEISEREELFTGITLSIGIIGEYIGKMYNETKARPRYVIEENLEDLK